MKLLKLIEAKIPVTIDGKPCNATVSPVIGDPDNQVLRLEWGNKYAIFSEDSIIMAWEFRGNYLIRCMKGDWYELKIN